MITFRIFLVLSIATGSVAFDPSQCPDIPSISISGTRSVARLAQAWRKGYEIANMTTFQRCPNVDIRITKDDWGAGAARVCGIHPIYSNIDIAGMSGGFFTPQASSDNGWSFDCRFRSTRQTVLLEVGHEGVSVVTGAYGAAANCIERLGGLSVDQLRWIFSSYTLKELTREGVDTDVVVPFSDGDDSTHLWSELNENCTAEEILIASVADEDGAYEYFTEVVLSGLEERIANQRGKLTEAFHFSRDLHELAIFLHQNSGAIAFFQLTDVLSTELQTAESKVVSVAIRDSAGVPIYPDAKSFETNTYPLSRDMFVGIWNDPFSLMLTKPFIEYGMSEEGTRILQQAGYWSIDEWERIVMATRLQAKGGVDLDEIRQSCGPANGHITMAGSVTVLPVARIWSEIYKLGCNVKIDIQGGGSSSGAGRICANAAKGDPVDIGMMSRDWKSSEGNKRLRHVYECLKGDTSRSAIKIDVAYDGISVILKRGGIGDQCQSILGGFTVNQLRWIFSTRNEEELEESGWDPESLKNSDNDLTTHKWSELDSRCAAQEIRLAGDILNEGTHTSIKNILFEDSSDGEDIDVDRPLGYYQALGFELVSYVQNHEDAIAYIGYNYYFDNKETLVAAPIQNSDGVFVAPSATTIGDGSYNPFVRSIYMNLLNDPQSLRDTIPLLKFGYSHPDLVIATGVVPVQGDTLVEMLQRLHGVSLDIGNSLDDDNNNDQDLSAGVMVLMCGGAVAMLICLFFFLCLRLQA